MNTWPSRFQTTSLLCSMDKEPMVKHKDITRLHSLLEGNCSLTCVSIAFYNKLGFWGSPHCITDIIHLWFLHNTSRFRCSQVLCPLGGLKRWPQRLYFLATCLSSLKACRYLDGRDHASLTSEAPLPCSLWAIASANQCFQTEWHVGRKLGAGAVMVTNSRIIR